MPRRTQRTFYVLVRDHKRKEFEIFGPTSDDGPLSDAVVRENERGRDMMCEPVEVELEERDATLRWAESEGYKRASGILRVDAEPPSLYKGSLPQYAQGANRERVVQVFCKGDCKRTTWAEMVDESYCGKEALKSPQAASHFRAKCLVCGKIAADPYNWPGRPGE